jgi:hypothetical protein
MLWSRKFFLADNDDIHVYYISIYICIYMCILIVILIYVSFYRAFSESYVMNSRQYNAMVEEGYLVDDKINKESKKLGPDGNISFFKV